MASLWRDHCFARTLSGVTRRTGAWASTEAVRRVTFDRAGSAASLGPAPPSAPPARPAGREDRSPASRRQPENTRFESLTFCLYGPSEFPVLFRLFAAFFERLGPNDAVTRRETALRRCRSSLGETTGAPPRACAA